MFPIRGAAGRGGRELRAPQKAPRGEAGRIPRPLRTRAGGTRRHLPDPHFASPPSAPGKFYFIATFFPHPKSANRAALIFFFTFYILRSGFFKVRFEEKKIYFFPLSLDFPLPSAKSRPKAGRVQRK